MTVPLTRVPTGYFVLGMFPRAGLLLLEAQGDLFFFLVDIEHHHLNLLIELHHVAGVVDAAPAHVRDVEQPIDAAQIDERAEVGDVLDGPLAGLADGDFAEQLLLGFATQLLQQFAAADDDVAPLEIDLKDFGIDIPADVLANVRRAADIHLRRGKEDRHADIDQQAALDLPRDCAGDRIPYLLVLNDVVPAGDAVGLALRDDDQAIVRLDLFKENRDIVADFNIALLLRIPFALQRKDTLGLQPDFNHDIVAVDVDNFTLEDCAIGKGLAGGFQQCADFIGSY